MQFIINQVALMQALNAVKAACKKRSTEAILSNVLIQVSKGLVRFTTTDQRVRITYTATDAVQIVEEGEYTADYQQLVDTVKALPKRADITLRQQESTIELACSGRKFIRGTDAGDYPAWEPVRAPGETYTKTVCEYEPDSSGGSTLATNTYAYEVLETHMQQVCVPHESLVDMLEKTTYAAEDDYSQSVLRAIFTNLLNDQLTVVAADHFRFVEHKTLIPSAGSWDHSVLIDAKYFVQIAKLFRKNTVVSIIVTSTTERLINKSGETVFDAVPHRNNVEVRFASENTIVHLRPKEGTYPNYQGDMPKKWTTRMVCDTTELLSAYQTVWPVARDASNISRLHMGGNRAFIEASTKEQSEPTVHEISATITGPDTTVILNCKYMLDFLLKEKDTKTIVMELTKSVYPVLLRPEDEETRYVVMPMSPNR